MEGMGRNHLAGRGWRNEEPLRRHSADGGWNRKDEKQVSGRWLISISSCRFVHNAAPSADTLALCVNTCAALEIFFAATRDE